MIARDHVALKSSTALLAAPAAACTRQLPGLGLLASGLDLLGLLLPRPSAAC
jgi:hypothetical protein